MREDAKARRGSSMYIKTSVCVVGGGRDEKKRYDHCVTDRQTDGQQRIFMNGLLIPMRG